jgi:hypothetical protein
MVFKATRLMHDQLTLKRAKVNTARLRPDQVKIGAALLRRLMAANERDRSQATAAWNDWRRAKEGL